MNEIEEIDVVNIEDLIYEIRGHQVMLDRDLAKLYRCANGTKSLNLAVKRHLNRFPERFMFQLTLEESSRFQNETLIKRGKNIKYLPYAFTEQGVAMLSAVLKTEVAEKVSIQIMDAFVALRKLIANNTYENRLNNIETKVIEHDAQFNQIFSKLEQDKNNHIFFEGQIFDAYSLLIDILSKAKENIIIIDNYIDKSLLSVLSKINLPIRIVTNHISKLDIEKYKNQYNNVFITLSTSFHDRFIILDQSLLYHCGASFKDLGKKCFAINKIEDENYLKRILQSLNEKEFKKNDK